MTIHITGWSAMNAAVLVAVMTIAEAWTVPIAQASAGAYFTLLLLSGLRINKPSE